jgi:uncharacterized protein
MSFYAGTAPLFIHMLTALSAVLKKGQAYAEEKKIKPEVLLNARLHPTMFPLINQVQLACDFSGKACARLAHVDVPSTPDTEKTLGELRQRLANTVEYLKKFTPAQFEGGDTKEVTFPTGPDKTLTLKGQEFLNRFAFANFYFHAATAHGILRHNGVEIGKRDFLGVA